MGRISNNLLAFLYIIIILTTLTGLVLIISHGKAFIEFTTGKVTTGRVGVCVGITPVLNYIGGLNITVNYTGNEEFYYDVDASAGTDALTYYDNASLFNINPSTGVINFTANRSVAGTYYFRIWGNNSICDELWDFEDTNLTVRTLNNPPILNPIIGDEGIENKLNATENEPFYYDVNATDQENAPNGEDGNLTYAVNETWVIINSTTGEISFTPDQEHNGQHWINISVTDLDNGTDSAIVNFSVKAMNDAPILFLIPNFTVANNRELYEDQLFYYEVNAYDEEDDELEFSDNSTLFNLVAINSTAAYISFTPDQSKIGNHSVEIYVVDAEHLDMQKVLFEIVGANDPPVLQTIGAITAWIDEEYYRVINASDEESNYPLIWHINDTTFFNLVSISNTEAEINFTPDSSQLGTYWLNITVNDTLGAMDSEAFTLTITGENRPPNITFYFPVDLTPEVREGGSLDFSIIKEDPEGTVPSVQWYLDGVTQSETTDNYTYYPNYAASGIHNVTVIISDGLLTDQQEWRVTVVESFAPSAPSGTGGAAARGARICNELWICSDWSPCQNTGILIGGNLYDGIQIRICTDQRDCGTIYHKPNETRYCIYTHIPSCYDGIKNQNEILVDCGGVCPPCPTCDDGIQNQGEIGIDCGGPCLPCPVVEKPRKVLPEMCGNGKIEIVNIIHPLLILAIISILIYIIGLRYVSLIRERKLKIILILIVILLLSFVKTELFTCLIDSLWLWILIIVAIIILIIIQKRTVLVRRYGISIEELKDIKRINNLITNAKTALRKKETGKLRVLSSKIKILYNSLSTKGRKRVYNKIKRLNEKIEQML